MITELGAKRAMRVLREAGFIVDEERLPTMAHRWVEALNEHGRIGITDDELEAGAQRYVAQDHPLHHWPSAGQLETCALEIRNRTESRFYTEPENEARKATAEERHAAWAKHLPPELMERIKRRNGAA